MEYIKIYGMGNFWGSRNLYATAAAVAQTSVRQMGQNKMSQLLPHFTNCY